MAALTVEDVKRRVEEIREMSGDYECAHAAEDRLREDVLRAIAGGARVGRLAQELAGEALKSTLIDFPRYCA